MAYMQCELTNIKRSVLQIIVGVIVLHLRYPPDEWMNMQALVACLERLLFLKHNFLSLDCHFSKLPHNQGTLPDRHMVLLPLGLKPF
jgi:hypothetical protein